MRQAIREIVESRELLLELALRDIRIRYKQSLLGIAWALFMPVMMMLIFTLLFSRIPKRDIGNIPYPIFVYCGLLPWQFFAGSLKGAVESLTRNSRLVTKIYFPREVFPLAQIISCAVDFAIASVVLVGLMAWYGYWPKLTMFFLPVILLVQVALTVGLSLLLSMANLFYRDVKYVFEVTLLLWMFASSVVYPVPGGRFEILFALNPMTHIIEGYRQVLLLGQLPDFAYFAPIAVVSALCAMVGLGWFHRAEYLFAENI